MYDKLKDYVSNKQLQVQKKVINGLEYELYCYTKNQFFSFDWDDITLNHRGRIYHNGVSVNNPFPKIFNVGENPQTELENILDYMDNHKFEVLDKLNGHLVIISSHLDTVFVTTKGSFEGDLAKQDEILAESLGLIDKIRGEYKDYTFLFECLADYDKHLFFKEQQDSYGVSENTLILIGVLDNEGRSYDHRCMLGFADYLGIPVTKRFKELETPDFDKLYDHKDIEGYVFHFPDINFRFKIKTSQYTTLRYMKEITSEKLVNKFYNSGIENLYLDYDEELYPLIDSLKGDYYNFLNNIIDFRKCYTLGSKLSKKDIFLSNLDPVEKSIAANSTDIEDLLKSKSLRKQFKELNEYPLLDNHIEEMFDIKKELTYN